MDRTRAITVGSIGTVVAAAALALAATTGLVTLPESTPTSAGDPPVTVTTSPTAPASDAPTATAPTLSPPARPADDDDHDGGFEGNEDHGDTPWEDGDDDD